MSNCIICGKTLKRTNSTFCSQECLNTSIEYDREMIKQPLNAKIFTLCATNLLTSDRNTPVEGEYKMHYNSYGYKIQFREIY